MQPNLGSISSKQSRCLLRKPLDTVLFRKLTAKANILRDFLRKLMQYPAREALTKSGRFISFPRSRVVMHTKKGMPPLYVWRLTSATTRGRLSTLTQASLPNGTTLNHLIDGKKVDGIPTNGL